MERAPTRVPGEGGIELESTAGNLQLESSRVASLASRVSRAGKRGMSRKRRGTAAAYEPHEPGEEVPASGVYNVVDRDGNYLKHQITCHKGDPFPPASHEELLRRASGAPYRYELAYEAVHLAPGEQLPPHPTTIFLPGEPVPISGVYNVVDRRGNYLSHQRAWVEKKDEFGPPNDSAGYGYVLAYAAKHLTHP
jgi:hypothetical protein